MKPTRLNEKKLNYTALAFALPVAGMLLVMIISQYFPFGKYSMLYSDMYHQYYPFFKAFRSALLSGDSLLHSWNVGLGMDYLGLISYYLASPLNLVSILLPEAWTLHYFSLLVPIKLGLASMFFAIFLKNLFGKNDWSIVLFGAFYGLCAWALGYQWNVMWLDTFALLPLVVLGMIRLLSQRKFILYTLTLFLSIFANYYVGLFTCIFILLSFFCYEICQWGGIKKFFIDLGLMALFSALAIGMTAILELPAFAALQTTHSSVSNFRKDLLMNIADEDTWLGLLDAMRQVAGQMNGGISPTFVDSEGLPNLYCGVLTSILTVLFLLSRDIKLREKLCCAGLLLFFSLSFIIRHLDYVWHGFHFPNSIPFRFSFLYSFVMLYMAYKAYLHRRHFRLWQLVVAGIASAAIMLCYNDLSDIVFWAYNIAFVLLYLATLSYGYLRKKLPLRGSVRRKANYLQMLHERRKGASTVLLAILAMELVLTLVNFGVWFAGSSIADYPRGTESTASIIRYMHEREDDTLFFRAETTHSQTLNDGALNGYNGISTFTSSANADVTRFMKALGYSAEDYYNRYCYEEASPVSNLFLNIKYMIERRGNVENNPYFNDLHYNGDVHLLKNSAYLPLGFLANTQLINVDFSKTSEPFTFQNTLFSSATGIEENVWHTVRGNQLSISGEGVEIVPSANVNNAGFCDYAAGAEGGKITFTYVADREGLACVHMHLGKKNTFSMLVNGEEIYGQGFESYSLPQMFSLCQVAPGDVIEVIFSCNSNEDSSMNVRTAILDETVFYTGYNILSASQLELTEFGNTYVAGTIQCDRNGVLYTSIPQNGNWTAIVDHQPAKTVTIGNAMVGVLLTEGYHEVEFKYDNAAFSLGWKISLLCALIFGGICLWKYLPKKQKGKFEG